MTGKPGNRHGRLVEKGLVVSLLRKAQRWEQRDLARAAEVHVDTIKRLEQGRGAQNLETLARITKALGVSLGSVDEVVEVLARLRGEGVAASGAGLEPVERTLTVVTKEVAAEMASKIIGDVKAERRRTSGVENHAQSKAQAPVLWARLEPYPEAVRRELVRQIPEFHSLGLCESLCDKSLDAASDSADRAASLADLAVEIANRLPGEEAWRARRSGYAQLHLANAMRVGGRNLPGAEVAFLRGEMLWQAGAAADRGELNGARVLHLKASLRRAQGRPAEALTLLDKAITTDKWGETPALLLGKAKTLEEAGDMPAAIASLQQASVHFTRRRDPWKYYIVRKNLAVNLCALKRFEEADALLADVRSIAAELGKAFEGLRVGWLESRMAAGKGRLDEAVMGYERVRAGFAARENAYDVGLVTLELAEVLAVLGHTVQVRRLARESLAIFDAQAVHRERRQALDLLRRSG